MNLIQGEKKLAGAKPGDRICIVFLDSTVEYIILDSFDRVGIEGFATKLTSQPLERYPWSSIKKVRKDDTTRQDNTSYNK